MNKIPDNNEYSELLGNIGKLLEESRKAAIQKINNILVQTYWNIGKRIVEFEQDGKEKADYGSELLKRLSNDLKERHGKGFSKTNIYLMRLFYLKYEKIQTVSGKLSGLITSKFYQFQMSWFAHFTKNNALMKTGL